MTSFNEAWGDSNKIHFSMRGGSELVGYFEHQPAAALRYEACRHAALEVVVVEEILDVGGER